MTLPKTVTSGESHHGWLIAADIGGTFTDVIALGPHANVVPVKVLSTPSIRPVVEEARTTRQTTRPP
jgi:N-methylhydantoinase A